MPTADRESHTHEKLHAATEATRRGEDREGCRRSIHPCLHPSTRNVLVILCALTRRPSTGTKDYFCGGRNKTPQRSFSNIPYLFYLCLIYFRDILLSPLALFLFFVLFFIFVHFLGGRGGGPFPLFLFLFCFLTSLRQLSLLDFLVFRPLAAQTPQGTPQRELSGAEVAFLSTEQAEDRRARTLKQKT